MARPTDPAKLDHAVDLYVGGKTGGEVETVTGVSRTVLYRELTKRGLPRQRLIPTPDGLIEDYLSGSSVKACASRYGIDRKAVYRMLSEAGIDGRNRSEAMQLRWVRASAADRQAMLAQAHAASRDRVPTDAERVAIANAKDGKALSALETQFAAMLAAIGVSVELGVPCGPYNLDLVAADTVAVEIFGGNWHARGHHRERFPERARHVLNAGYSLAIVWVHEGRYPLGVACAQHLSTLVQITRGHPSIGRQHWVIRGDGHFLAIREDDGDEVPFILPSGRREN